MENIQTIEFKNARYKKYIIVNIILCIIAIVTFFILKNPFFIILGVLNISNILTLPKKFILMNEKIELYSTIGHEITYDIYLEDILNIYVKNKAAIIEYQLPRETKTRSHSFNLTSEDTLRFQEELVKRNPSIDIQ